MQKRHNLLLDLYQSLEKSMGPAHWWPAKTPFEVCIGAILTQNAPWAGVRKAIAGLQEKSIFTVNGIAEADERMLAEAVRPAIYHNQKARRIKTFCRFLRDECNGVVEEMRNWELPAARGKLLPVSRASLKTASSADSAGARRFAMCQPLGHRHPIITGVPCSTMSKRAATSALRIRTQPWLSGVPMRSSWTVPWM